MDNLTILKWTGGTRGGSIRRIPPDFGEELKQAMQCCSEDLTRQVLRGACLDARDEKARYVAGTSGRFLYSANSFTFPMKEAVIVPDSKFINGSGLLDNEPCFLSVQPGKKPPQAKQICLQTSSGSLRRARLKASIRTGNRWCRPSTVCGRS